MYIIIFLAMEVYYVHEISKLNSKISHVLVPSTVTHLSASV